MDPEQNETGLAGYMPPVLLPRSAHTLSRTRIDEEPLKVLYRLHHHGYLAYLVGGSVRDILLGRTPKDFDVGTNARPHEVNALFRNSRIIGRRFRLVQVYFKGGTVVEVSTFRSRSEYEEIETEDGTTIRTDSFGTPDEDAFRRDRWLVIAFGGVFSSLLLIAGFGQTATLSGALWMWGKVLPMRTVESAGRRFGAGFRISLRSMNALVDVGCPADGGLSGIVKRLCAPVKPIFFLIEKVAVRYLYGRHDQAGRPRTRTRSRLAAMAVKRRANLPSADTHGERSTSAPPRGPLPALAIRDDELFVGPGVECHPERDMARFDPGQIAADRRIPCQE